MPEVSLESLALGATGVVPELFDAEQEDVEVVASRICAPELPQVCLHLPQSVGFEESAGVVEYAEHV